MLRYVLRGDDWLLGRRTFLDDIASSHLAVNVSVFHIAVYDDDWPVFLFAPQLVCPCRRLVCLCFAEGVPHTLRPFRLSLDLHPTIARAFVIPDDCSRAYLSAAGPTVQEPSDDPYQAGVFADATVRPSARPGLRSPVLHSQCVVFQIDDFITSYQGPLAIHRPMSPPGVVNPYLWSPSDESFAVDGRPIYGDPLSYGVFINDGFGRSNSRIDEVAAHVDVASSMLDFHRVGVLSMSTIFHSEEVFALYGHGHWLENSYGHSVSSVVAASAFYRSVDSPSGSLIESDSGSPASISNDSASVSSIVSDCVLGSVNQGMGVWLPLDDPPSIVDGFTGVDAYDTIISSPQFYREFTGALALLHGLEALKASLDGYAIFYYHTGASLSICSTLSQLLSVSVLSEPLTLGGIATGITVTHRGCLKFLPPHLATCYYSAQAQANLISLGHLQRHGAMYASIAPDRLLVTDRGGVQLDLVVVGDNRLSVASLSLVASTWSPQLYAQATVWAPVAPRLPFDVSHRELVVESVLELVDPLVPVLLFDLALLETLVASASTQHALLVTAGDACFGSSPLAAFQFSTVPSSARRFEHYTAEQRTRCDRVQTVHSFIHVSDDVLGSALDGCAFPWANVTSADVRLNCRLRGPCVQCLEAKLEQKGMPPSSTPPAASVGAMLSIAKSAGGNLNFIDSFDEFSGDRKVTPCRSLGHLDIYEAIMELVHTRYNAYGHVVETILADSLPAFTKVIPMLGAVGIRMILVIPGQHAQRVERSIGSLASSDSCFSSVRFTSSV